MIRRPHRVNFRLSDIEKARYEALIHKVYCVHNWTDLCLKALEELHDQHMANSQPLGSSPFPSDVDQQLSAKDTSKRQTPDRPSDNTGAKKARGHRYKDESGRVIRRVAGKKRKKVLASKNGKH